MRFDAGNGEREALATDISEGGLHLVTNEVSRVGSRLQIDVELDGTTTRHECEVMWAIRVPDHLRDAMAYGMGVRFLHPPAEWSGRFRKWRATVENPSDLQWSLAD